MNVWKSIDAEIKIIEKQLKLKAELDPKEKIYRSVPGVGVLSARILADELGDFSQFKNERQLFSYTGLTPSEHSSGDKIRKGHITRQGNQRVRRVLNQVAWRAIKKDPKSKSTLVPAPKPSIITPLPDHFCPATADEAIEVRVIAAVKIVIVV